MNRTSSGIFCFENGVLRMERERDEREKAACLVLLIPQPQQVVDPLLVGLDMPVQHRAVRRDPQAMRRVVREEPEVRMLLPRRDQPPDAVGEHLRAAPRKRAQADVAQRPQHLLV
jgi:hypothetical protein